MKLTRKKRAFFENPAFSDIAFLLIIYFLVIAGFTVNRGFLLSLPENHGAAFPRKAIRFVVNDQGRVLYGNRVISYREAESELRLALAAKPDLVLVLDVWPEAPWQSVVSFVEIARKNEVSAFSFAQNAGALKDGGSLR